MVLEAIRPEPNPVSQKLFKSHLLASVHSMSSETHSCHDKANVHYSTSKGYRIV